MTSSTHRNMTIAAPTHTEIRMTASGSTENTAPIPRHRSGIPSRKTNAVSLKSIISVILIVFMACMINSIKYTTTGAFKFSFRSFGSWYRTGCELGSGGLLGMPLAEFFTRTIGTAGTYIVAIVVILACLIILVQQPLSHIIKEKGTTIHENAGRKREENRNRREVRKQEALLQRRKLAEDEAQRRKQDAERAREKEAAINRDREIPPAHLPLEASDSKGPSRNEITEKQSFGFRPELVTGEIPETMAATELTAAEKKELAQKARSREKAMRKALKKSDLPDNLQNIMGIMSDEGLVVGTEDGQTNPESEFIPFQEKTVPEYSAALENIPKVTDEPDVAAELETAAPETKEPAPRGFSGPITSAGSNTDKTEKTEKKPAITNTQAANVSLDNSEINKSVYAGYKLPPYTLLARTDSSGSNGQNNQTRARKLEETFESFNVNAKVVDVEQGPSVTRYEVQPAPGVKVSSIVNLSNDIALSMAAKSIRIEAPIPGKSAVGIEIENETASMVGIREILESREFNDAPSKISFCVGKSISGKPVVANLGKMPHMLIAGATGSGKSVCINNIIASILFKAKPDEVKLILIDPKVVELSNYNGIPHLLTPVVTEPSKAAAALNWAVREMDERYNTFAKVGAKDLDTFNRKMTEGGRPLNVMPKIVIIIDELADLMMQTPTQVEASICRLAQKARATGIHLIVATQRPSVDVITGLIKANIPSRIAFATSSQIDSRTILDMPGAEKLLGNGDMLFSPIGMNKPERIQGSFISDQETADLINFVKAQVGDAEYSDAVREAIEKPESVISDQDEEDELFQEAVEVVVQAKQASASMLQRRFRIGYNRAARIIDTMEAQGIIGPQEGSKPRKVILTEAELEATRSQENDNPEVMNFVDDTSFDESAQSENTETEEVAEEVAYESYPSEIEDSFFEEEGGRDSLDEIYEDDR